MSAKGKKKQLSNHNNAVVEKPDGNIYPTNSTRVVSCTANVPKKRFCVSD